MKSLTPVAGVAVNAYEYWCYEQNEYEELYLPAIAGAVTSAGTIYYLVEELAALGFEDIVSDY